MITHTHIHTYVCIYICRCIFWLVGWLVGWCSGLIAIDGRGRERTMWNSRNRVMTIDCVMMMTMKEKSSKQDDNGQEQ